MVDNVMRLSFLHFELFKIVTFKNFNFHALHGFLTYLSYIAFNVVHENSGLIFNIAYCDITHKSIRLQSFIFAGLASICRDLQVLLLKFD